MGIEVDGANQKLILDSDGDTYLEAATDDTIKYMFRVHTMQQLVLMPLIYYLVLL